MQPRKPGKPAPAPNYYRQMHDARKAATLAKRTVPIAGPPKQAPNMAPPAPSVPSAIPRGGLAVPIQKLRRPR